MTVAVAITDGLEVDGSDVVDINIRCSGITKFVVHVSLDSSSDNPFFVQFEFLCWLRSNATFFNPPPPMKLIQCRILTRLNSEKVSSMFM
ncbi:unnamed protein product [Lactuca virosa]|uniref:Uncharacterized protein n=1 Tax=Lactuca virosa TaxID=75947 RepID=A0AAU9NCQ3_9ASTR|nr:unnamed protein product [Lactuca virosa]